MKQVKVLGIQPGSNVGVFYGDGRKRSKVALHLVMGFDSHGGDFVSLLPWRLRDFFRFRPFILRIRKAGWKPIEVRIWRRNRIVRVYQELDRLFSPSTMAPYFHIGGVRFDHQFDEETRKLIKAEIKRQAEETADKMEREAKL